MHGFRVSLCRLFCIHSVFQRVYQHDDAQISSLIHHGVCLPGGDTSILKLMLYSFISKNLDSFSPLRLYLVDYFDLAYYPCYVYDS